MRLLMVAICLYMIWGYSAQARAVTSTSATTAPQSSLSVAKNKVLSPPALSLALDLSIDSNLRSSDDPELEKNLNLTILPSLKINKQLQLGARLDVTKKLYANEDTQISNLQISLIPKAMKLDPQLELKSSTFVFLPTDEIDRKDNTFQGAAGGAAGLLQHYALFKKSGSVESTVSILKNFHEYETNNDNAANLSHRVRFILALQQDLIGRFNLEILGRYQLGWTYLSSLQTAFLISEQLSYEFKKDFSAYMSHTNAGDALRPNGIDSNVRLYDENTSTWGTGVSISF